MRKPLANSGFFQSCINLIGREYDFDTDSFFQLNMSSDEDRSGDQVEVGEYSMVAFQEQSIETDKPYKKLSPLQRLRALKKKNDDWHPSFDERTYTKFTPFADDQIKDFLNTFSPYGEESCRSSIVRLQPGKFLRPHFDCGPDIVTRFQIPLVTNPGAKLGFRKNKRDFWNVYRFEPGYIYFINTGYEHYATNYGSETRFHVRVCCNGTEVLKDYEEVDPMALKVKWNTY